jgi:competence protein ComEC
MQRRKLVYGILATLLALSLLIGIIVYFSNRNNIAKIIFLDVGQGDAILISKGSQQVLIDGGKDGKIILEKLGRHIPFWDRNIEVIIATHPDQDHIGGLVDVLGAYNVKTLLKTNAGSDSQTYQAFKSAFENEGLDLIEAKSGLNISFPSGESLEIIYPTSSLAESDTGGNDSSVVAKFITGKDTFLFTGDIPQSVEEQILSGGIDADFLKVAHHGSKYSTGDKFLEAVSPAEAVISVGKKNSYGHPSPETLVRLQKGGAKIYRTDEMGDIVYECKVQEEKCSVEFD